MMDIDISVVIVDYYDSSSSSISLLKLLFVRCILLSRHNTDSSSSSIMTLSLISIGSHFNELPILIKLLLIRLISSVASLDSIYHCRRPLTHSHLFLWVVDEIVLHCSGI